MPAGVVLWLLRPTRPRGAQPDGGRGRRGAAPAVPRRRAPPAGTQAAGGPQCAGPQVGRPAVPAARPAVPAGVPTKPGVGLHVGLHVEAWEVQAHAEGGAAHQRVAPGALSCAACSVDGSSRRGAPPLAPAPRGTAAAVPKSLPGIFTSCLASPAPFRATQAQLCGGCLQLPTGPL